MLHFLHRLLEADEERMGDDGVADVQFVDTADRGDGLGVVVVQAVACVDDQPVAQPRLDPIANPRQLTGALCYRMRVGICLLYTSPSPRDRQKSRMPSSA